MLIYVHGIQLHAQQPATIPTTQPSTQPSTQPAIQALDTIPNVRDTIMADTILADTIRTDSTRRGRKPPPKRQKKAPQKILSNEVYYFYQDRSKEIIRFRDTIIDNAFLHYDPARAGNFDYATLGAPGGPMQSLHYRWVNKNGTRLGVDDVFRPYIKDENDLPFYTKSKAFTNVYYAQGTEQNDHVFRGDFGRSFDNGIKFSLRHDRLIHTLDNTDLALNTNAFFTFPSSKNTSLITGLAFQKEGSKYQAFLTYIHNEVNQLFTGGLETNDSIVTIEIIDEIIENADALDAAVSIPSTFGATNANLRYRMRSGVLDQHLTLAGKNDSTAIESRLFNLNHKLKYTNDIYRFSDSQYDSLYYLNLATDIRGVRLALQQKILENYVGLSTFKTKNGKILPSILGDIKLGLRHQLININAEVYEERVNNLFAEGSLKICPFKSLTLEAFGQIGLLDNIGDFMFNASAALDLEKWGTLKGRLRQQRYSPSILEQQNYLTQIEVWNTDFNKSFNSELGFRYLLDDFQLEAGLSYFLLDNHIYFTDDFVPTQKSGAINLVQAYIKKDFNWKILHLENLFMVQSSTDEDIIKLPSWWSRHSLYVQRKIFKNIMQARFGLDLRMSNAYYANNFNPALAQFYVQSEREVKFYPAVDAHFAFVVREFRIFFKMENITSLITDDVFTQIPYYPQKELAFRFGLSWRFLDQNSNKRASNQNKNQQNNSNSRPPAGVGG